MAVGYGLLLRIGAFPAYASVLLPTMLLVGAGGGVCFPALSVQATMGIADHEQGLAAGLVQTSLQMGGAIGLAVVSAIVTSGSKGASDHAHLFHAYHSPLWVVAAIAVAGLVVAVPGRRGALFTMSDLGMDEE
jgi:hypothetical protein